MSLQLEGIRLPLASFTLEVDAVLTGRVTALFGASGAGKTSLLEVIAGLRRPAAGRVVLDGEVLTDGEKGEFVKPQRRAMGYVPQEGALFPHLTTRQNLLYGYAEGPSRHPEATFEHVVEVLEIGRLTDRRIGALSGGERQRVALGRALLASPRLLLMDEPLSGLDTGLKERLMPYLRRIRDEFAIPMLYVTHSADEVMALCDDALLMESGRIVKQASPETLFTVDPTPRYRLSP